RGGRARAAPGGARTPRRRRGTRRPARWRRWGSPRARRRWRGRCRRRGTRRGRRRRSTRGPARSWRSRAPSRARRCGPCPWRPPRPARANTPRRRRSWPSAPLPFVTVAVALGAAAAGQPHLGELLCRHAGLLARQVLEGHAVAGRELVGVVHVPAHLEQPQPAALEHGTALLIVQREAVEVAGLVGLERRAVGGVVERHQELVERVAPAAAAAVEDDRPGDVVVVT